MDFFSKPLPKSAALPPKDKEEADGSANKKADEEDEEPFDEELAPVLGGGKRKKHKPASDAELKEAAFMAEQEKRLVEATQLLQEHFSTSQQDRYEAYRRSNLKEGTVRKVMNSVSSLNVPKNTLVVVRGAAKLYVGELVESARTIMDERGEQGAIRPWHIREAYQRLIAAGRAPTVQSRAPHLFSATRSVL